MALVHTHTGTLAGHQISLEFDQKMLVMNRVRLSVDGQEVDEISVVYGEKELSTTLADGTEVVVHLHSGLVGELVRPQLRLADGTWADLLSADTD